MGQLKLTRNRCLRTTRQLLQKIWMKPAGHRHSEQQGFREWPRTGQSWSLRTQTLKPNPPLTPCKEIKKKKIQIKLPTLMISSQKHGQCWTSNIKLSFKETNQPFGDKLITLYPFHYGNSWLYKVLQPLQQGIISFLF